jgi:pimeloyl-ACP methyl ester carboxylesterase
MLTPVIARSRALLAACAAVAVLAGCTQTTSGTAAPGESAPAPAGLERVYAQKLDWGPCRSFARTDDDRKAYADPAFTCAKLTVPLDYAQPAGTAAQIGVLRQKATGRRIGSLLFNPGGPGASGMSLVSSLAKGLAQSPLSQRFDLVGFDPRGVGSSTPAIDCLDTADWTKQRADLDIDPSPAGVAQTEAENKTYANDCVQRSGGAQVLANMGTRDVVKDLDVLRAVLGDRQLSYVGFSYGTRIGSAYAEAFPQNVRALVLDGALDPTESTIDRNVKQTAGFQKAFQAFADDCAKTNPSCPLGTDPAQATAGFQALSRALIDKPLSVGGRELSYTDAITGTVQALYLKELWPALQKGISGLATGNGAILMLLADLYYGRQSDGSYDNDQDAFTAISCVDEERITDRAVVADTDAKSNAAAPFQDDGRGVIAALDPCAFWPVPPTSKPHVPSVAGLPPTLVVSTTGDPATPYQAGVDLAKELGGSLLTYEGTQHTVALRGVACVDDVVTAYLVDARRAPDGTRCT